MKSTEISRMQFFSLNLKVIFLIFLPSMAQSAPAIVPHITLIGNSQIPPRSTSVHPAHGPNHHNRPTPQEDRPSSLGPFTCFEGRKIPHPLHPNEYLLCHYHTKAEVWLTFPMSCPDPEHKFDQGSQKCQEGGAGSGSEEIDPELEPGSLRPPANILSRSRKHVIPLKMKSMKLPMTSAQRAAVTGHPPGSIRGTKGSGSGEDDLSSGGSPSMAVITQLTSTIKKLASTVETLVKVMAEPGKSKGQETIPHGLPFPSSHNNAPKSPEVSKPPSGGYSKKGTSGKPGFGSHSSSQGHHKSKAENPPPGPFNFNQFGQGFPAFPFLPGGNFYGSPILGYSPAGVTGQGHHEPPYFTPAQASIPSYTFRDGAFELNQPGGSSELSDYNVQLIPLDPLMTPGLFIHPESFLTPPIGYQKGLGHTGSSSSYLRPHHPQVPLLTTLNVQVGPGSGSDRAETLQDDGDTDGKGQGSFSTLFSPVIALPALDALEDPIEFIPIQFGNRVNKGTTSTPPPSPPSSTTTIRASTSTTTTSTSPSSTMTPGNGKASDEGPGSGSRPASSGGGGPHWRFTQDLPNSNIHHFSFSGSGRPLIPGSDPNPPQESQYLHRLKAGSPGSGSTSSGSGFLNLMSLFNNLMNGGGGGGGGALEILNPNVEFSRVQGPLSRSGSGGGGGTLERKPIETIRLGSGNTTRALHLPQESHDEVNGNKVPEPEIRAGSQSQSSGSKGDSGDVEQIKVRAGEVEDGTDLSNARRPRL